MDRPLPRDVAAGAVPLSGQALPRGDDGGAGPREGGTGFYKIRKIVAHDIGELEHLDFDFVGKNQFLVQIAIRPDKL